MSGKQRVELQPRDYRILRHVARYRLTIREALRRHILGGTDPGSLLQRLRRGGYLKERTGNEGFPERVSYYQLTEAGASAVGASPNFSKRIGARVLHECLALLWVGCLEPRRRVRLVRPEVERLLAAELSPPLKAYPHCLDLGGKRRVLLQAYVPKPGANPNGVVQGVEKRLRKSRTQPDLAFPMREKDYGVLVLVDERPVIKGIKARLGKRGILQDNHVVVAFAPSPSNIARVLRELRTNSEGESAA